ncbi:MAG TPA: hypothetical protein VGO93_26600 [Candidatus Xenobia bacterium]|jgi:hypothetical protein
MPRRLLVAVYLILALSPWVLADGSSPAAACKSYFVALNDRDYATCWKLCSGHTRDAYVRESAGIMQVPPADARHLFDSGDSQITPFWDNMRKHARADIFVQLQYKTQSINGNAAVVTAIGPKGSMPLQAFKEGGSWKFGVMESSGQ